MNSIQSLNNTHKHVIKRFKVWFGSTAVRIFHNGEWKLHNMATLTDLSLFLSLVVASGKAGRCGKYFKITN